MSASLVANRDAPHLLEDDLESAFWVLLWMALMYSVCSDPNKIGPFMDYTIDPKIAGPDHDGPFIKADFLKGRSLLQKVHFTDRPALDTLLMEFAKILSARYEEFTEEEKCEHVRHLQALQAVQSLDLVEPSLLQTMRSLSGCLHRERLERSKSHAAIIGLFDDCLADRSAWPINDVAQKQRIRVVRPQKLVTKSEWSTTLVMCATEPVGEKRAADDSSEDSSDSDLATVVNSPKRRRRARRSSESSC